MKNLLEFLNALPTDEREPFATRCGTTFDYLRQVGYGNRPCRESLAINIERESHKAVTCEYLCPDVDWAYLRTSPEPQKKNRSHDDPEKIRELETVEMRVSGPKAE